MYTCPISDKRPKKNFWLKSELSSVKDCKKEVDNVLKKHKVELLCTVYMGEGAILKHLSSDSLFLNNKLQLLVTTTIEARLWIQLSQNPKLDFLLGPHCCHRIANFCFI